MDSELDDRLAHDRAGRRLQEPFTRPDIEFITGQDHRRERIAENLSGSGIAHPGRNRQDPPGIGDDIFLPRARDSDRDDALPDGQTICATAEFVDHADGFDAGHSGEFRGKAVSAADGMQIAGLDWRSGHPDPDLAGTGLRYRAGLHVQNLGRFTYGVGNDRAHCSHLP